ncbi:MAG: RBBP9/YdeN family alpha/beta hydrolase [Flavobacteriaceae bacterium]
MKAAEAEILILPGIGGGRSSPDYWYWRWRERMETARLVEQEEWEFPDPASWVASLHGQIAAAKKPVVLVGHSAGALTIARAFCNARVGGNVVGALIVAPADPHGGEALAPALKAFQPTPTGPLPFPSILIASRDDPYCDFETAADMALDWGSELADAGNAGHINIDSGHGPWPEGMMMFARLLTRLKG